MQIFISLNTVRNTQIVGFNGKFDLSQILVSQLLKERCFGKKKFRK
jgi:hypothetical protein